MKHTTPPNPGDMRNMIITAVLCTGLLFVWQVLYVNPREEARRAVVAEQATLQNKAIETRDGDVVLPNTASHSDTAVVAQEMQGKSRDEVIEANPRVRISSQAVHGSINLQGLRFDDLTLARHRVSEEENSPEVVLLTPAQHASRYFAQIGWLASNQGDSVALPDSNSLWTADSNELTPRQPVTFSWDNGQNVTFRVQVALDENYLFTIRQQVVNNSTRNINVLPYGLINRSEPHEDSFSNVLHRGPIGVFNGELTEVSYKALREDEEKHNFNDTQGWLGMADKYWLTAFIPEQDETFNSTFQHVVANGQDRTQVDYLAKAQTVAAGATAEYMMHVFAGAKELDVLEHYREQLHLPLFDRALDFGVLYFLTKPIFMALDYFYGMLGNFGLAIMLFVVMLKLALFPLSNKSYRSMAQMRVLQPQIEKIRKEYDHDRIRMQQEVMAVWKRERVNPVSGCLPMLIQIPIFFSLYKVLLVTIEMRHAPFYGWINDLSAPDPTNIFTLFGLLQWNPPALLHIGVWPIVMAATMVLQQKLNPKPTDPVQAKVIGWLPYIFLVLFASFPAGLLIYWAWNNLLSIAQQAYITHSYEKQKKRKADKLEFADSKGG
jgi:YidC/Oxa1 family membrane protein insertase